MFCNTSYGVKCKRLSLNNRWKILDSSINKEIGKGLWQ